MGTTGVLLASWGAPSSLDDIEGFLSSIMGRPASPEEVENARIRYLTIGGLSPLPLMAERIASFLERRLSGLPDPEPLGQDDTIGFGLLNARSDRAVENVVHPVQVGMVHARPSIADAVGRLVEQGADRIVWASLSPFEAEATSGAIRDAVTAAAAEHPAVELVEAPGFHRSSALIGVLADACMEAQAEAPEGRGRFVVFTAHSLPLSDPSVERYAAQLEETAEFVAARSGLGSPDEAGSGLEGIAGRGGRSGSAPWVLAYQSSGARGGEWLGPALLDVIDAVPATGAGAVIVCPIGFMTDHMETLYDIDVVAAERVYEHEMEFVRAGVPNDSPKLIEALEGVVRPLL